MANSFRKTYDDENRKGEFEVRSVDGSYGPTLVVNGREVGYLDFFPPTEGGHPQFIFFDEDASDEPLCKVIVGPRILVTINKDVERVAEAEDAWPIHHGQHLYGLPAYEE